MNYYSFAISQVKGYLQFTTWIGARPSLFLRACLNDFFFVFIRQLFLCLYIHERFEKFKAYHWMFCCRVVPLLQFLSEFDNH